MRGVEAAVDAQFTGQLAPVFRVGSPKWVGTRTWGFYVNLFFSICIGDQASLAMGPLEWLRCWDEQPRLMAILLTVQARVRWHFAAESEKAKARMKHGGAGNVRTPTPAPR